MIKTVAQIIQNVPRSPPPPDVKLFRYPLRLIIFHFPDVITIQGRKANHALQDYLEHMNARRVWTVEQIRG